MLYLVSSYDLLNEFRLSSIDLLETNLNSMAPSLCEYHFENIVLYSDIHPYLNKNQIAKEFYFGDFRMYIDYENNIYIEKDESYNSDDDVLDLW